MYIAVPEALLRYEEPDVKISGAREARDVARRFWLESTTPLPASLQFDVDEDDARNVFHKPSGQVLFSIFDERLNETNRQEKTRTERLRIDVTNWLMVELSSLPGVVDVRQVVSARKGARCMSGESEAMTDLLVEMRL